MDATSTSKNNKQYNRDALVKTIEFYRHNLNADDKKALAEVLDSLFLTTGSGVARFEQAFAAYMEARFAVGVMSCTHALELALRCFNIGAGDEVITTPLSFMATANVIELVGARPVFVDVEERTGNIDVGRIEAAITKNTKAILPVHLYGQMCDMRQMRKLADAYKLKIIEDCAHCIEGSREGIRPGMLGDAACYSFYATKNLTCGEGGAISCNDEAMYNWFLMARQHGMSKSAIDRYTKRYDHYDMEILGLKCNMSNLQAALLIHQLGRIEGYRDKKEAIAQVYDSSFIGSSAMDRPDVLPKSKHARHLYTIWVNPALRDRYMHQLQDLGIGVAVNFRPIHLMKYYREKYHYKLGDFPIAEKIGASTISIPFYPGLSHDELQYISETINNVIGE